MAESRIPKKATGTGSSNASALQIIAPGNNGQGYGYQRVVIDGGWISLKVGGTASLLSIGSSAVIMPAFHVGTNTIINLKDLCDTGVLASEPGEGISLTTTGGGDYAYEILYHYEP